MTHVPDPAMARLLATGGEMGRMIADHDWRSSRFGETGAWPQSLRSALSICLASRFPMLIFWGPDLAVLYNDTYRPMLGSKHPGALGQPARVVWSELWPVIGPMMESVLHGGRATFSDDLHLVIDRHGYLEETYWTFSYSPVLDEAGAVGGVFCAVTETTDRVLSERRINLLRALGGGGAPSRTVEDVCGQAAATLATRPDDLPFSLIYLLNEDGRSARLAGHSGALAGEPIAPLEIPVDAPDSPWRLRVLMNGERSVEMGLPASEPAHGVPPGAEPPAPTRALVLALGQPAGDGPAGFLVTGISPRRALDDDYRAFVGLIAERIATMIADAAAHEAERRRAEALAAVDRVKTEFFANVSHEFRTPLMLMLGPLEALLADPGAITAQQQRDGAEAAHRNALRLLKLVNTLLDFASVEAGRVRAVYQPVDLAASTADLVSAFRAAMDRAGLTLVVDCPPLPAAVYVDPTLWERIILNLVSNAFKYTTNGEIRITVRADDGYAVCSVSDTGIGIEATELPLLFDRFHRVREAIGRTHEGTGIGLSLVRELVILHGGSIEVTSTPGLGSTFTVCLPFGAGHLPPDQVATPTGKHNTVPAAESFVAEAMRWLPDAATQPSVDDPAYDLPAGAAPDARPEILVVDDNADMRRYLRHLLSVHWRVTTVPDGRAALDRIADHAPDLVLTDVMMPVIDGFQLLRRLRADDRTRELPVIVVTARADHESTAHSLASGASDYLVKPFTAAELVARVRGHLETARIRRAYTERLRRIIDAGVALSESVPTGDTGRVLAEQLLAEEARWCAIWLVHRDLSGQEHLGLHLAAAVSPEVAMALHDEPRLADLLAVQHVLATRQSSVLGGAAADWPAALRVLIEHPVYTLPLTARGVTFGAVTVSLERGRDDSLLQYIEEIVSRGAMVMDNARLFQNERRAALGLQRSLLPPRLPELTGAAVAARYLPGAQGAEAGGDWYDVIALDDGRVGLTVGDVMGRGMQAAALMGQVRSGLRSYALEGMAPAAVLQRLDAFLTALDTPQLTTCLYAIFDPRTGDLCVASAGHPPPLIRQAGEPAVYPSIKPGLPLGLDLGPVEADELTLNLSPGALLLLFTDGLVEAHDRTIDAGLERLRLAFASESTELDGYCDIALGGMGHMVDGEVAAGHDDIALLVLRRDR